MLKRLSEVFFKMTWGSLGFKLDTTNHRHLSRRERQIMDIVYALGEASVSQVLAGLSDPPSYSAIRALMRILEEKGHLTHRKSGVKFIYGPTQARGIAGKSALSQVLDVFYNGSISTAVASMLEPQDRQLTADELRRLSSLIEQARTQSDA